jgi:hypothetical protein
MESEMKMPITNLYGVEIDPEVGFVRISRNGKEMLYWDVAEFEEDSQAAFAAFNAVHLALTDPEGMDGKLRMMGKLEPSPAYTIANKISKAWPYLNTCSVRVAKDGCQDEVHVFNPLLPANNGGLIGCHRLKSKEEAEAFAAEMKVRLEEFGFSIGDTGSMIVAQLSPSQRQTRTNIRTAFFPHPIQYIRNAIPSYSDDFSKQCLEELASEMEKEA